MDFNIDMMLNTKLKSTNLKVERWVKLLAWVSKLSFYESRDKIKFKKNNFVMRFKQLLWANKFILYSLYWSCYFYKKNTSRFNFRQQVILQYS